MSTIHEPSELPFSAYTGTEMKGNPRLKSNPVKSEVAGKLNCAVPGTINVSQAPVDNPKLPQAIGTESACAATANSNSPASIRIFIGSHFLRCGSVEPCFIVRRHSNITKQVCFETFARECEFLFKTARYRAPRPRRP